MARPKAGGETPNSGSPDRPQVIEDPGSLCVSIVPRRSWLDRIFLSYWVIGWTIGEISVAVMLINKDRITTDDAFLVGWFVVWSIAGYFINSRWLFSFWGRKELVVGRTTIILRTTVLGQRRSETFDLHRLRRVRSAYGTSIAFEYYGKTHRFGPMPSVSACQDLLGAIERSRSREPDLKS